MAESKRKPGDSDHPRSDVPASGGSRCAVGSGGGRLPLARGLLVLVCSCVVIFVCLTPGSSPAQHDLGSEEKEPYSPELFQRLALSLDHFYLDRDRIQPQALMRKALSALENAVDEIYVDNSEPEKPYVSVHLNSKVQVYRVSTIDSLRDAVSMLESLFTFIQSNYQGEMGFGDIQYAVANGFLSGLDPHTMVFSPKAFSDFSVHIEGEIYGVGMYVGTRDGKLTVIEVLKETPAALAKFKKGDVIVKIGDESTINMSVQEAVDKIRGPLKSEVVLTVKRQSAEDPKKLDTLSIPVTRDKVVIKSVESKLITDWEGPGLGKADSGVGYVTVRNFDKNTTPSLRTNLARLEEENGSPLAGLILDLRGNSGGLLTQAVEMSDLFLSGGDIVVQAARGEYQHRQQAKNQGIEPRYPIVVLGDQASASGAEIVIGALQKNDRAVVLGTRTFGKGSVQQLHSLPGGAQLKITVSEYLIPGDVSIQENGVVPDILAQRVILTDESGREEFDLFAEENGMTEKDYKLHIVSRYAKEEKPAYTLKYLYEPIEYDPDNDRFVSGDLKPTEDKLVVTALSLLASMSKDGDRSQLLEKRRDDIVSLENELFKEIEERLGEMGIDWSQAPSGSAPASQDVVVELSTKVVQEPSGDEEDPIPVNKLLVTARLTNKGDATLYRVKGMSKSDYFLYKDREFLFGKVAPGETVERELKVRLPYFPHARDDLLAVEISGVDGKVFAETSTSVRLEETGRPAFSYAATVLDAADAPIESLAPGMSAKVRVKVTNTGQAPAHKGVVILRNRTGRQVFLEPPGRIEFEELGPGAEAEAEFRFQVRSGDPVKHYTFEMGVVDSYSGASLERELRILHQDEAQQLAGIHSPDTVRNGVTFEAPRITATLTGDSDTGVLVTDAERVTLDARIHSPTEVPFKYWVVHNVSESPTEFPDKILFADSRGRTDSNLITSVQLNEGMNLFTVIAMDKNGLAARRNLVVRRTAPKVTSAEKN